MRFVNNPLLTLGIAAGILLSVGQRASAATQTSGAGSAVTSVDRSANFNSIVDGTDLSAYSEGLLSITTPSFAYISYDPFNGAGDGSAFHYASGGNYDWVTIKTTDGARMTGAEFLYGNGWTSGDPFRTYGNDNALFEWETYNGVVLSDSGNVVQNVGTILGLSDPAGFDSIRIRATLFAETGSSTYQAIAIDNLKVQLSGRVPDSNMHFGLCLAIAGLGLAVVRRKAA